MSQKVPRNQRRKAARAAVAAAQPTPGEVVRRRRTRRLLLLAVVAVALPLLEVVAYRFRSILIVVANRSDEVVTNVQVTYPGGSFEAPELKAGGELTHVARPNYSFGRDHFSTYLAAIRFRTARGDLIRQSGVAGTIDYSARETYAIQAEPSGAGLTIKHSTQPGFPLSTIRDLFAKFGR